MRGFCSIQVNNVYLRDFILFLAIMHLKIQVEVVLYKDISIASTI
jgi:hypothetical protein